MRIEFLLEEQSAEVALRHLVPLILGPGVSFSCHSFQGKQEMLKRLPERLRAYARLLAPDTKIVVLLDRDADDCLALKASLEAMARAAGLRTRSQAAGGDFEVLIRIAVEELEAWYLGDVDALVAAFPRVPATLARRKNFRNPDAVRGGTAEALERVLKNAGHYPTGLAKIDLARKVARHMAPDRNRSQSFACFVSGLRTLSQGTFPHADTTSPPPDR